MKKSRGFTLIEILVTVTLLALITIIAVPSVISINKKIKEKMFNTKMSQAEEAVILWAQNNPNCITNGGSLCVIENCPVSSSSSDIRVCSVTLKTLAENDIIEFDNDETKEIINPIDNENMDYLEINFTYNTKNKKFNITKTDYLNKVTTGSGTTANSSSRKTTSVTTKDEFPKLLVNAIRENYPNIESPKTTPGSAVSTASEAVLAATADDYGTSYYFRGAVTNNYVQFANKCWRIVRITGNDAIKLVLHNDNVNKVSNPCNASNNDTNAAFARYSGTTYTSAFNSSSNKNAYVGLMYGTPGSSTYAAEHANTHDSTILTNLKKWYDLSFSEEQKNKLADVIYCGDKSTYKNTSYNPWDIGTIGTNYGIGTNVNYYSAESRIVSTSGGLGSAASEISPTLVCPKDNDGGNLSKYTAADTVNGNGALNGYKIGLLSADEIVFAGGGRATENSTYYLNENASGYWWWTSSPCYFYAGGGAFVEFSAVGRVGSFWATNSGAVRPAISLISSIKISSGTGTASDPFIIN